MIALLFCYLIFSVISGFAGGVADWLTDSPPRPFDTVGKLLFPIHGIMLLITRSIIAVLSFKIGTK